jgi:hypothetical protein
MFDNSYLQQQMQIQMQIRMQTSRAPGRLRSKFTVEEDARLRAIVQGHPDNSWQDIANFFPGKTIRQVRERYRNYLAPHLNHFAWTAAEDELLREKFSVHGPQWCLLKQYFVNRSDVNIKNRWSVLVSQAQRCQFESPDHFIANQPETSVAVLDGPVVSDSGGFGSDPVVIESTSAMEVSGNSTGSRRTSVDFDFLDSFSFDPFDSVCDEFGFGQY